MEVPSEGDRRGRLRCEDAASAVWSDVRSRIIRSLRSVLSEWTVCACWRRLSRRENCFPQWQANGRSPVCFLTWRARCSLRLNTMLQSPNPRHTNVLLGAARVRTGPTPGFFARGTPSSGPRDAVGAVGDVEEAFWAAPRGESAADGGVGDGLGGVLSVFILEIGRAHV